MSFEAKNFGTLEILNELGILKVKDMRIGDSGRRSISGGEKSSEFKSRKDVSTVSRTLVSWRSTASSTLCNCWTTMRHSSRSSDTLGRISGELFICYMAARRTRLPTSIKLIS
ncbi:hypothetical protein EDD18DRAFT_339199 [Armillaria luteobubalina]|uniref:Uncharacterized protein n=1 Tax=Armillaria luteobubalina TaxID=153913 RepID=A0AA39QPG4_9AGAR|nr:hypothetical protein EDD18DRAFT_339199 [Armillaria luteobubalina]